MEDKKNISLAIFGYSISQVDKEIEEQTKIYEEMAEAFLAKKNQLTAMIEEYTKDIEELEDILSEQNNQESLVKLAEDTLASRLDLLARAALEDKKKIEADFILQARELSQRGRALNERIADCKARFHQVLSDVYSIKQIRESDEKNVTRHIRQVQNTLRSTQSVNPRPAIKPIEPKVQKPVVMPTVEQEFKNTPVAIKPVIKEQEVKKVPVKESVIELPINKPREVMPERIETYSSADALAKSIISAVSANPNRADRLLADRKQKTQTEVVKNPFAVEVPKKEEHVNQVARVYNDPGRLSETWLLKYRYLCGKNAGSDIYSTDGRLIVGKDEALTQAQVIATINAGMLDKLVKDMY